jgi:hypothetical protein
MTPKRVDIHRPPVKPAQGWSLAGRTVVGLGEALETLSKLTKSHPFFDTFQITVLKGDPE